MSVEQNEAVVRRYFDEFWDRRNVALAPEIFAADFVFYAPIVPDGIHGAEAYRRSVVEPLLAAFPDLQLASGEAICQGDRVAMQFMMSGTHQGSFAGVAPTGKRFAVPGVVVGRIVAGRIAELRGVFDGLGMMQQLGVLPAPHQANAKRTLRNPSDAQSVDLAGQPASRDDGLSAGCRPRAGQSGAGLATRFKSVLQNQGFWWTASFGRL